MKKTSMLFKLFILALIGLSFGNEKIQAQDFSNAFQYLEYIGNEYDQVMKEVWDYTSTVAHKKSARKIDKRRKEMLKATMDAKKKVQKMPAFDGNGDLRDSIAGFLQMSYDVLNEDYEKIMDLEDVAEQSYDMMEAYLLAQEIANKKLNQTNAAMVAQYKLFALNHDITIIEGEDKISEKMKIASKVIRYYNKIYLIHFKSSVQNSYLYEALNKKDVNGMEQSKNALIKSAREGLEKLDTTKSFKGDVSIKTACSKTLKFYIDMAENDFPVLIEFYMKNEKFEKIQAAFNAKKQSERTKEDVDQFNSAVNDINKAAGEFNKINAELNEAHTKNTNEWNKAVNSFMDRHVPKRKGK